MIHILKSKSGYRVRYTAGNGEILAISEVLTSKANAWKNVRAVMRLTEGEHAYVTDEKGQDWVMHGSGKKEWLPKLSTNKK